MTIKNSIIAATIFASAAISCTSMADTNLPNVYVSGVDGTPRLLQHLSPETKNTIVSTFTMDRDLMENRTDFLYDNESLQDQMKFSDASTVEIREIDLALQQAKLPILNVDGPPLK